MAENKDYYSTLGINRDASQDDIKKAFRKASLKYHPDKQVGKSDEEKKEAEDKFKDIQEAYSVLSDEDKKARYDMFGSVDGQSGSDFGGFHFDFGGHGFDFSDIRDMFGGGRNRNQERIVPGKSHQMRIKLSIEDIYKGCTKTVKYTINQRCPNCHGKGGETHKCSHCNGSGIISKTTRSPFGTHTTQTVCSHCNGIGEIIDKKCPSCNGSGFREKEVTLEITIPAGIQNGQGIEYSGKGSDAKKPGHPSGSFIAVAEWTFDTDRYIINGFDILEKIYIPYEEAILGTKYHLELPDHNKVDISIIPMTTPGKRLLLRGKGITGRNMYGQTIVGNYIVEVNYKIPSILSDEEKEALEKIKQSRQN